MKNILKRAVIVVAVSLIAVQFIHPAKNNDPAISANDISHVFTVPENVNAILTKACNDCHTNNTTYPWYSKVQPVDWWLTNHIRDGKRHLNFSEFGSYTLLRQAKKLNEVAEQIEEGEMPLNSYTWIHRNAILTPEEKQTLTTWAKGLSAQVYAKVPPAEIEKDKKQQEERRRKAAAE